MQKQQGGIPAHGTGQQRWDTPIRSESTSPEALETWLVKSASFKMKLRPDTGTVFFESVGRSDAFELAAPRGDARFGCPHYVLEVLDASEQHALVNKICRVYERKPNRKMASTSYLLYDRESGRLRPIFQASDLGPNPHVPHSDPLPVIKRVADGYEFKWSGMEPNGTEPRRYNNKYVIGTDKKTGRTTLQCLDMNSSGSARTEGSGCAEEIGNVSADQKSSQSKYASSHEAAGSVK